MTYRLLITGSQVWRDRAVIGEALERLRTAHREAVVVHGACRSGADYIAEEWCLLRGQPTEPHPAKWKRPDGSLDKGAGFARNVEMAQAGADYCLAFWDGKSPGTQHMIGQAVLYGIGVRIIPMTKPGATRARDTDKILGPSGARQLRLPGSGMAVWAWNIARLAVAQMAVDLAQAEVPDA